LPEVERASSDNWNSPQITVGADTLRGQRSTVRYLGIEVDDAIETAEKIDI
jgi:hypothetical protein